ncbi:hypothetical protein MMC30_008017 [Trapelia coarctata]|nr:hypothetical protein [Trapelia coarctata]
MAMEYRCSRCDCSFETQEAQLQHMDDHRHEECDFCRESYGEGRDLVKHEALEHDRCEVCQKDFAGAAQLRQHSRVHKAHHYRCFGCGAKRTFESYSAMLIHLESGRCKTSVDAMDAYAAKCYQRKKYVVKGYGNFLRYRKRAKLRARRSSSSSSDRNSWECAEC